MPVEADDQVYEPADSFISQSDTSVGSNNESNRGSGSIDSDAEASSFDSTDETESSERAARRKRHVRLFCFSCNRYEGHSVASRSRLLYSFLVGFSFGLYYYFGRYSCHCCGSIRLARRDYLNPRFWYRSMRLGGMARSKKAKPKSRSRRRG